MRFANMKERRACLSCVFFKEIIVVCGGFDGRRQNTVESMNDTWSSMPNMIEGRSCHSSVARSSKMLVIGSQTCEVFSSTCGRFVLLTKPTSTTFMKETGSFCIGSQLTILCEGPSKAVCHDVETNKKFEKVVSSC